MASSEIMTSIKLETQIIKHQNVKTVVPYPVQWYYPQPEYRKSNR